MYAARESSRTRHQSSSLPTADGRRDTLHRSSTMVPCTTRVKGYGREKEQATCPPNEGTIRARQAISPRLDDRHAVPQVASFRSAKCQSCIFSPIQWNIGYVLFEMDKRYYIIRSLLPHSRLTFVVGRWTRDQHLIHLIHLIQTSLQKDFGKRLDAIF